MKNLKLLILVLVLVQVSANYISAQFYLQQLEYNEYQDDYNEKYSDQLERGETIIKSGYHFVATATKDNKSFLRIFYPERKQIVSHEEFKDSDFTVKSGYSKYWYENGNLKSEGYYKNNQRVGQWKLYSSEDGSLSSSGIYRSDKKNGIWTYFEHGDTSSVYTYSNDVKEGPFIQYDSDGKISNQGAYDGENIYSKERIHSTSDTLMNTEQPLFKHGKCDPISDYDLRKKCAEKALLERVYSQITYPNSSREHGIQGTVIIQLNIDEKGILEDYVVLRGICDALRDETIRVISTLPKWRPGTANGTPVKSSFILPVQYRIEN